MIKNLSKIILIILIFILIFKIYLKHKNSETKIENFTPIISKYHVNSKKLENNELLNNQNNFENNKNYAINPIDYNNPIQSKPLSVEGTRALNYINFKFKYGLNNKLSITYFDNKTNQEILKNINNVIFINQYLIDPMQFTTLEVLDYISKNSRLSISQKLYVKEENQVKDLKQVSNTDLLLIYEDKYLIFTTQKNNKDIIQNINNIKTELKWQLNIERKNYLVSKLKDLETKKLINLNNVSSINMNYLFVCGLNYNYISFIIKPILGIRNFKEIKSFFKFAVLYRDDYSRLKKLLRILHIKKPNIVIYNDNKIFEDFKLNKIHIIFMVCPHPNINLSKLSSETDIMILDIDNQFIDQMIFFFGDCLFYSSFKASQYNIITPTGNINTYSIRNILCAKNSTNSWNIFLFLKLIINHLFYIKGQISYQYSEMTPSKMSFIHRSLHYHPGAANFWELNGNLIIGKYKNKNINTDWYFWGESNIDSLNDKRTIFNLFKLKDLDSINRRSNTCFPDVLIPRPNYLATTLSN